MVQDAGVSEIRVRGGAAGGFVKTPNLAPAQVIFNPRYNPRWNPVEELFSAIKQRMRQLADTLKSSPRYIYLIKILFATTASAKNCTAWFSHAKYPAWL